MEPPVLPSKRRPNGIQPQPGRPPIRRPRDRRLKAQKEEEHRQSALLQTHLRRPDDGNDPVTSTRHPAHHQYSHSAQVSSDVDRTARHFHVASVGAGGTLYLKPTRITPSSLANLPATPPATSAGFKAARTQPDLVRASNASDALTLRLERTRNAPPDLDAAYPPSSVKKTNGDAPNKPTRSLSFSTINERSLANAADAGADEPRVSEASRRRRRRSFTDLPAGLLNVSVPHYRLGTPRFSEQGTAYLHYSTYTTSSDGVRSSILSGSDQGFRFPPPPGRAMPSFVAQPFTLPQLAQSLTASSTSTASPGRWGSVVAIPKVGAFSPELFDKLEAGINDPAVVRYHPTTGRIVAASPARLIAQITSPEFLDYELLADFFLTFRCFMPCHDVLEYLVARMQWAFCNTSDAGRIVRVRTFVALRHWILNYFPDDFKSDYFLRRRFCDLVNALTRFLLRQRPGQGSDLKILGELKKCWQRTCALHWPVPDVQVSSPDAHILPGGEPLPALAAAPSALSLPLTIRPTTRSNSIFEMAQVVLPDLAGSPDTRGATHAPRTPTMVAFGPNRPSVVRVRNSARSASIPASPMSEQSLEVLSCSVPFLRNIRSPPATREKEKPPAPAPAPRPDQQRLPPSSLSKAGARHAHKRSGSFSDALRDQRAPLPSTMGDGIEMQDLPFFAFTGGLVRGILLQPSPAKIDVKTAPVHVGPESRNRSDTYPGGNSQMPPGGDRQPHSLAVRKIVGDMRRAMGSRKGADTPSRGHKVANSLDTRTTGSSAVLVNKNPPPRWQHPPSLPRIDLLAAKVESSYQYATESARQSDPQNEAVFDSAAGGPSHLDDQSATPASPVPVQAAFDPHDDVFAPSAGRLDSHITSGSQSILIMDATGSPSVLRSPHDDTLSSFSPITQVDSLHNDAEGQQDLHAFKFTLDPMERNSDVQGTPWQHSWDARLHDLGIMSEDWNSQTASRVASQDTRARKSSYLQPAALNVPRLHHQLRRRPGGDLKATDRVHELGMSALRPHSVGTFTEATHSYHTSYLGSRNASGLHRSHHHSGSLQLPLTAPLPDRRGSITFFDSISTQPHVRPSFEAEANILKNLSTAEEDGGIEDALLKLEGKIPSPSQSNFSDAAHVEEPRHDDDGTAAEEIHIMIDPEEGAASMAHSDAYREGPATPSSALLSDGHGLSPVVTETQGASIYQLSESCADSVNSRVDWPLANSNASNLNLAVPARSSRAASFRRSIPAMTARITRYPIPNPYNPVSETTSLALIAGADPADPLAVLGIDDEAETGSRRSTFYVDNNDTISDISTEIADHPDDEQGVQSFHFDDTVEEASLSLRPFVPPPTPPSTIEPPTDQSLDHRTYAVRAAAASPSEPASPIHGFHPTPHHHASLFPALTGPTLTPSAHPLIQSSSVHMPFVLAFESEIIAEQLTIIEKDALDEVDWKDLIGLHWQQSPPVVQNWVDFLQRDTPNGIDIVIARFNIVVKWVVSEILLTDTPAERARTITKFIHIACHARKLRNFASVYQITLALLSSDLALLHLTWARVQPRDRQMLHQLETLCQPLRNFHNLRAEMETALPDTACIPFIGLYTHDLMLNGQKSPQIGPAPSVSAFTPPPSAASSSSSTALAPPLVNFERYQTAATIVKSLLRLIEASAKFVFRPHPETLSRCLWIAALDEPEIAARAKLLERGATPLGGGAATGHPPHHVGVPRQPSQRAPATHLHTPAPGPGGVAPAAAAPGPLGSAARHGGVMVG